MPGKMRHVVLLIAMLFNVKKQPTTGHTLKDVLKSEHFLKSPFWKIFLGVDVANIAASGQGNLLSSSQWSIRFASHYCLVITHGHNYKTYLYGTLTCLNGYHQFCIRGNAAAHVQEMTSERAPNCMQVRFSEQTPSQKARIWDIHVLPGFHINLTVTDLQMTYHPRGHCHDIVVQDGRYTGQGLAIGNYAKVCQRTKHHSYLLPMSKARVILNYTRIPDRPFLEFLYEAIIPQKSKESYITLWKLNLLNLFYFEFTQNTKSRLILYAKSWVRLAISLTHITLVCENNINTGKKLSFIDGPVFLVSSYLQRSAFIASLECDNLVSSTTNASLKGNDGRYLYMDQVKASIGDLTIVLEGPDVDMSTLNFSFRSFLPDTPYGHFNVTDYTNAKEGDTSESVLANLDLPIQGRHFHLTYWLQRRGWASQVTPRLVFQIKKFDMVSFQDGCHTGGVFIAEGYTNIASYCSQAGIAFLNSTTETGGILFGASPLVVILKGYSWFATIQLNISVIYDSCIGVTNICDKFMENPLMFPHKCDGFDNIPCRHVTPSPCIEIVRLPSDGLSDYSAVCEMISHLGGSPAVGHIQFLTTLLMTFAVKGQLELEEAFPMIYPEYMENFLYMPLFPSRHSRLQLKKTYRIQAESIITNIKNTLPWLGVGHWIRLMQVPGCNKEAVSLQPLGDLQIFGGCGELRMGSVTGRAKVSIHKSVFLRPLYSYKTYQFLNAAIFLSSAEGVSNYSTESHFSTKLQWSSVDGLHKKIIYTRRQYLEINVFNQDPFKFAIDLEWNNPLDDIQFMYVRRGEMVAGTGRGVGKLTFDTSWIGVKQQEVCFSKTLSCYRYQEAVGAGMSGLTWNMAQARCVEQNSNLVSINSPYEWHSLLGWAYNFHHTSSGLLAHISAIQAFKGRLLFIGQRRMKVSNSGFFL